MLGQSGSLSLSAINLETGISEPHHQICHVTQLWSIDHQPMGLQVSLYAN